MVRTKHQKSKPKKQPQAKKQGKQSNISDLRAQLDLLDLKIVQVTADGLWLISWREMKRNMGNTVVWLCSISWYVTVKYREQFEPFIEDDVPFDEYCQSMGKDATWAGHMELQAASLMTRNNICIHRHMSPRWYIRNFDNQGTHMIHLSYHDEEHYNSVRVKEDQCSGPAKPIIIKADVNLTASAQQAKAAGAQSKARPSKNVAHEGAVKMVMAGSGCDDAEQVEHILLLVDGDVDAATEYLIAEREAGETTEVNDVWQENYEIDNNLSTKFDKHEEKIVSAEEINNQAIDSEKVDCCKTSSKVDKKFPNKVCPCGSKKKYKACCGAASRNSCSKVVVDHEARARRGKRGKQGKKVVPITKAASCGSNNELPDMGALCI
ncbi:OVARIAN TUMOR DOMAIN-containing deubiquitinating enzyme 7 isoform X2 [Spinacia oleracea]|uniref:OVARIAN TUMOR DOMAIN-containing deubiquitinating enzyme 7 isoform X2 n=1 Tax=Spinacia oleracea TaxID=3562 RepID=A0A9R0KBK5_SPIOL|nr:OVARIAN TUMOR DOMAIN-containing deubiquitinating enzyme 7 isoform X2 [Spinacia oleracea]